MRRLSVRFRSTAVDDLEEIHAYVLRVSGSRTTAKAYVRRLKARCDRIGNVPFGGRSRDDLHPGLRTVSFEGRAVVTYTVENGRVWVANIFYGGRDYEAIYRDDTKDD